MSPEAWIALFGAIFTLAAIVYYAGKIVGKLDALGEKLNEHISANDNDHRDLFRRLGQTEKDVSRMEGGAPHRHGSGGYSHAGGH